MAIENPGNTMREKRLQRALNHVQDYWFPVNSDLLKKIQANLRENYYQNDKRELLEEVRSDFSLFAYCLKELVAMVNRGEEDLSVEMTPLELMQEASLESLKAILDVPEQHVSKHRVSNGSDQQIERFQEMLIASSATEALAPTFDIDSDRAFTASVLRQLGLTLIAWNYPGVYQEAISSLSDSCNLEQAISSELGFSPQLLAVKLLMSWGLPAQNLVSLGLPYLEDEMDEIAFGAGDSISELCEIGEALARANNPETYPSAQDDWSHAKREIESRLGSEGLSIIKQRLYENCEYYLNYAPEIVSGGLILDPEHYFTCDSKTDLGQRNPYYAVASQGLQEAIKGIYEVLDTGAPTEVILKGFVRSALLKSIFSGGYVYTFDPTIMMLMPQLELGDVKLREFCPVDYSVVVSGSDLISVAYQNSEPVIEFGTGGAGDLVSGVAGIVGRSRRIGVLYLETSRSIENKPRDQALLDFKALSFTLSDCLRGF